MSWLNAAWQFEYALLPCLTAYLVFDIITIIRRVTRSVYLPLYFAFFPFGYTDNLYAQFNDHDPYLQLGDDLTDEEREAVGRRLRWVAAISMTISTILNPLIAGVFCYLFLTENQFYQFLVTLFVIKAALLTHSWFSLRNNWLFEIDKRMSAIAGLSVIYLGAIIYFTERAYRWAVENGQNGYADLARSIGEFVFEDVLVGIALVLFLSVLLSWRLNDRRKEEW